MVKRTNTPLIPLTIVYACDERWLYRLYGIKIKIHSSCEIEYFVYIYVNSRIKISSLFIIGGIRDHIYYLYITAVFEVT